MGFSFKDIRSFLQTAKEVKDMVSANSNRTSSENIVLHENMTEEEENAFLEQQQKKLTHLPTGSPKEVMETIRALGEAASDAIKFCELQETKREGIRAQRDLMIERIDRTADLIKDYLDKTFDERRYQFDKYFTMIDRAIETGDQNLLALSLQNINQLSASSPFKDLKTIGDAINNPNTEWDI